MQGESGRLRRLLTLMLGAGLLLGAATLGGCAGPERTDETESRREARSGSAADEDESQDDSLTESAAAAARQLEDALGRTEGGGILEEDSATGRVQWQQTWPERSATDSPDDTDAAREAAEERQRQAEAQQRQAAVESARSSSEPAAPQPHELLEMLLGHVGDSQEPAMQRALTAATLRAAVGDATVDRRLLDPLGYTQRRAVERYQRMVLTTMHELGAEESGLDRATLMARLDTLFEHEPVEIRKLALCREVSGYGIYEAFERHTFLAGQRQRLILYVELDHFHTEPTSDGRYEVKLQQQVVLYNESDGLAVWRQDPVSITDVSRNRRRDFFVVQLITLPQRLNVGNYRLKVRVSDEHSGSVDEITTRIRLVADEKLLHEGDE